MQLKVPLASTVTLHISKGSKYFKTLFCNSRVYLTETPHLHDTLQLLSNHFRNMHTNNDLIVPLFLHTKLNPKEPRYLTYL